jgi:NADH-quinone oxidoreductase subunit L
MLRYIVFAPLLGAAINWFIGRRIKNEAFIGTVACLSVAVSTLFAFIAAFGSHGALKEDGGLVMDHLWTWIQVGNFRADFGFAMDQLSGIYTLFITFVGLLIHIFATGYMHGDTGFYRFFAYLNLFMFSMLTLVLGDNFLMMFAGWEGVGLCSYLLIGYYIDRKEAGDAAKKAFIANRVGDWGVILGVMLVFFLTGSISFFPKEGMDSALTLIGQRAAEPFGWEMIFAGGITSVAVLLFIGATGKSAQIPLYVWLPDAMAGPTPVSALIHAATMVTAGVYMIVRCNAIYSNAPTALFIVAIIGAATAVFAATIGLAQNDIKKVLAYSTVSQLGYMMLACGVGAYIAAIFHVMTHAFFKALLFLGSGSVIHGMHHEQDMRRMGGLKRYMKITWMTMMAGWLAICGIPIFAGFFSKDEILWKTWNSNLFGSTNKILWGVGAFTAALTAIYMTRMMIMTFWGDERFRHASQAAHHGHAGHHTKHDDNRPEHHKDHRTHVPHESPWVMTVPLIILAVLSTLGGLVGVPYALSFGGAIPNYFEDKLAPVVERAKAAPSHTTQGHAVPGTGTVPDAHPVPLQHGEVAHGGEHAHHSPEEINAERAFSVVSILIALAGIGIGWMIFRKQPLLELPRFLENKYYVDEAYDAAIINPIKVGSREGLWKIFDLAVIDGIVNGLGKTVTIFGRIIRFLQPGFVRSYAAIILFGALAIIGYFAYQGVQAYIR